MQTCESETNLILYIKNFRPFFSEVVFLRSRYWTLGTVQFFSAIPYIFHMVLSLCEKKSFAISRNDSRSDFISERYEISMEKKGNPFDNMKIFIFNFQSKRRIILLAWSIFDFFLARCKVDAFEYVNVRSGAGAKFQFRFMANVYIYLSICAYLKRF